MNVTNFLTKRSRTLFAQILHYGKVACLADSQAEKCSCDHNELVCDYVMLGIIKIGHLGAELC